MTASERYQRKLAEWNNRKITGTHSPKVEPQAAKKPRKYWAIDKREADEIAAQRGSTGTVLGTEQYVRLRGDVFWFDFMCRGERHRSTTHQRDRKLALKVAAHVMKTVGFTPEPVPIRQSIPGQHKHQAFTRGYVYFVQCEQTGNVKIGWATNVERRMKSLQAQSATNLTLLRTFVGRKYHEKMMHRRFAAHRLHYEWFAGGAELMRQIERLTQADFPDRFWENADPRKVAKFLAESDYFRAASRVSAVDPEHQAEGDA